MITVFYIVIKNCASSPNPSFHPQCNTSFMCPEVIDIHSFALNKITDKIYPKSTSAKCNQENAADIQCPDLAHHTECTAIKVLLSV